MKYLTTFLLLIMALLSNNYGQVKEGDKVPDFSLPDKNGNIFHLNDHLGKKNMVIYFYPKDETAGCTAQACSFRDSYDIFLRNNTEVIGISADSPKSHSKFASNHHLPFILLSDEKNEVRKLFGVPGNFFGLIPGRVTYVVDTSGIVQLVFNSQSRFEEHAEEALRVLKE